MAKSEDDGMAGVFKALSDPTRRRLLDRLHEDNGQTLNALGGDLAITRQGITQHLEVLEAAGLVTTVRRGREKLHYLNPVPLHEVYERWIAKFEQPDLAHTFGSPDATDSPDERSRVTFDIETVSGVVKLTMTHENLTAADFADVNQGWPIVLSSLKSYVETGTPLSTLVSGATETAHAS